jgi:hypothetical protein
MFHGLSFGAEINPWVAHQVSPFRSRGFLRSAAVDLPLGIVTPLLTFTTDGLAVRLARLALFDNWGGSATLNLYIRSRGAILEEYSQQLTHDADGAAIIFRLDALCMPFSQIELSMLNLTDSGTNRPLDAYLSGWCEEARA